MQTQPVDPSVSRTPLPLDADDLATVCVLCSHNCGLRVDVRDGEIVEVRARRAQSRSPRATSATRRSASRHYVQHAQRDQHPLRRRADGTFERISLGHGDHGDRRASCATSATGTRRARSPWSASAGRATTWTRLRRRRSCARSARGAGSTPSRRRRRSTTCSTSGCSTRRRPRSSIPTRSTARFLLVLGTNPKISQPRPQRDRHASSASSTIPDAHAGRRRPARDRDHARRAPPPARAAGHRRLPAARARRRDRARGPDRRAVRRRAHDGIRRRCAQALAAVDVAEMARRCGLGVEEIVGDGARLRERRVGGDLLRPRRRADAVLDPDLVSDPRAPLLTGNVGNPGGGVFLETLPPPVVDPSLIKEPERALASGIPAIRALGNAGMFSPTLVPEEILIDHPERIRAVIVEGSNPLLSYSDTQRWREAREQLDLLVVIDPAMTETARARGLRAADARRLREVGVRHLPEALPGDLHAGAAAASCRRRPRRCRSRRSTCASPRRWTSSARCRPSCTSWPRTRSSRTARRRSSMARTAARLRRRDAAHLLELPRARSAPARAVARRHLAARAA